jgi:hypothetical protein
VLSAGSAFYFHLSGTGAGLVKGTPIRLRSLSAQWLSQWIGHDSVRVSLQAGPFPARFGFQTRRATTAVESRERMFVGHP